MVVFLSMFIRDQFDFGGSRGVGIMWIELELSSSSLVNVVGHLPSEEPGVATRRGGRGKTEAY